MAVIYENLRDFRLDRGLTQNQLGGTLGLASSVISRIEGGYVNPSEETVEKFKRYFGVYKVKGINYFEDTEETVKEAMPAAEVDIVCVAEDLPESIPEVLAPEIPLPSAAEKPIEKVYLIRRNLNPPEAYRHKSDAALRLWDLCAVDYENATPMEVEVL